MLEARRFAPVSDRSAGPEVPHVQQVAAARPPGLAAHTLQ